MEELNVQLREAVETLEEIDIWMRENEFISRMDDCLWTRMQNIIYDYNCGRTDDTENI